MFYIKKIWMAIIGVRVFQHHKKKDGTYNVKVSVCHKRKTAYISTSHYLSYRKLNSDLSIKSYVVNRSLFKVLDDYREMISMFEDRLNMLNARELRDLLVDNFKSIDFLSYCKTYVDKLTDNNRKESASNYRTCYYSLIDFFNRECVGFNELTANTIEEYQSYLKGERILVRQTRDGSFNKKVSPGLSQNSISGYLIHFKAFFNSGREYYNNNSYGITRIKNDPFQYFEIPARKETKKRNLTITQVVAIKNTCVALGSITELAKDMFMLSFYLCGMNAVDLHAANYEIKNGRIEYYRSKTKLKRKDNAFISIKLIPAAEVLLERHKDLDKRYKTVNNLNKALNKGLKEIGNIAKCPELTFYSARHTFASLARNDCRVSKDDVAAALNHVDQTLKTTDIYIAKDWSIIDRVQRSVVKYLNQHSKVLPASVIQKYNNVY